MESLLFLATEHGLVVCERVGEGWRVVERGLEGHAATSVIAREGVILAGTTDGVFRSDDLGRTWEDASAGLEQRHVRWMAYHPQISDREFVGTEPAGIFVSDDGAATWRACPEVAELRDRHGWFLPYSPEAGCVRGFAFHGPRAYAAVEVGGALRSDDGGETWRLADGSTGDPDLAGPDDPALIYPDVHAIMVHPSSPDLVYAPTGGGFYRSTDGGKRWTLAYDCYCRAAWIDPADSDHIILGPADLVNCKNGRVEASRDGGRTWRVASAGLEIPWRHHMVERFAQAGGELLAILSNGELIAAPLETLEWRRIVPEIQDVAAAATMG